MDDNYKTPLITAAIEMAARNIDLPEDAGPGCFDNALAEPFNAAVKVERVHRTAYPTRKKAKEDIARYIELRYNRVRLHSALGYRTPQEAHDEYLNRQLAA
jgi:transposase InsO family protein